MSSKKSKPSGILTSKATGISIAALIAVALAGAANAQSGSANVADAACDVSDERHTWAEIEEVQVAQEADIVIAGDCLVDELWVNTDIKTAAMSNDLIASVLVESGYEKSDILGVELVSNGQVAIFVDDEM